MSINKHETQWTVECMGSRRRLIDVYGDELVTSIDGYFHQWINKRGIHNENGPACCSINGTLVWCKDGNRMNKQHIDDYFNEHI